MVQASSFSEVKVDSNTVVFLDVDDTLICYPSHLGNERWFVEQWALGDQERFHRLSAFLATALPTVPVEEGAPEIIAGWQTAGARVIAITSRALEHPVLADWQGLTHQQIVQAGFSIPREDLIFVGDRSKGEVIAELVSALPFTPAKVLLFDDRLSDLGTVGEGVTAVWYRACEPRRAAYDSALAARELGLAIKAQFLAGRSVIDQGE